MAALPQLRSRILRCSAAPENLPTRHLVDRYLRISTLAQWAFLTKSPIMIGAMSTSRKTKARHHSPARVDGWASPTNIGSARLFPTKKRPYRPNSVPAAMSIRRKSFQHAIPASRQVRSLTAARVCSPAPKRWPFLTPIQRSSAFPISIMPLIGAGSGSSPFRSSGSCIGCSAFSETLV